MWYGGCERSRQSWGSAGRESRSFVTRLTEDAEQVKGEKASGWVFSKRRRLTEFGSKIDVHLIYSPSVLECEWAAEIRRGAGMKESSGWIQPDLKLHSTQQEKGRRVNV